MGGFAHLITSSVAMELNNYSLMLEVHPRVIDADNIK